VSLVAARDDYGVVLVPAAGADSFTLDEQATAALRARLQAGCRKDRPIIDRGEGYEKMLRGEVVPWTRSA
jgi:N-methylhydantoinase B